MTVQLLFCQANSPLYGYNDYSDLAIYTVIGRALRNGQVLYRDVFDHKGPIFFFLSQIFYYNETTAWIVDILTFSIQALYLYKQLRIFKSARDSLHCTIFIMQCHLMILWEAGQPEQVFMQLIYVQLYLLLAKENDIKTWAIFGTMVSYVFYTKINIVLFWVPMFVYLAYKSLKQRKLIKNIVAGLIPFIIQQGIVFGYFIKHKALNEFIHSYFILNINYQDTSSKIVFTITQFVIQAVIIAVYAISNKGTKHEKQTEVLIFQISICQLVFAEIALSGHIYTYYIMCILPQIQILFLNKRQFSNMVFSKMIQFMLYTVGLSFCMLQSISFIQNHQSQFLRDKSGDVRYQFYIDAMENEKNTGEQFGGVVSLYQIQNNLAYYIENNNVKYQTFCNMTYNQNPDMYEYTNSKLANKEIEYAAILVNDNGDILTSLTGENKEILSKTLDILERNYEEFKRYPTNDGTLVVYKAKTANKVNR